ncbi:PaaI family thioesterase [Roseobacteraceae bacterium S113]
MNALTKARRAEIEASFGRQSLMTTLGARLVSLASDEAIIEAPLLESSKQQHGFAHAGLTFSIGDSAAGYAAMTRMAEGHDVLTAEIKINLLAPAKGPLLRATGSVIKPGRRLIIVTSLVQSLDGDRVTDVALLQGTMVPVG